MSPMVAKRGLRQNSTVGGNRNVSGNEKQFSWNSRKSRAVDLNCNIPSLRSSCVKADHDGKDNHCPPRPCGQSHSSRAKSASSSPRTESFISAASSLPGSISSAGVKRSSARCCDESSNRPVPHMKCSSVLSSSALSSAVQQRTPLGHLQVWKLSGEVWGGELSECRELNLNGRGLETHGDHMYRKKNKSRIVGQRHKDIHGSMPGEGDSQDETDMSEFKNVVRLDMNDNKIQSLSIVQHNKSLRWLSASNNLVKRIRFIRRLSDLRVLNLSHNKISNIENLQGCTALQTLVLSNNNLETMENLGSLSNLVTLILSNNGIRDIPSSCVLPLLRKLSLGHNQLSDFPFGQRFPLLEELRLNGNNITSVQAEVQLMGELSILDIGKNRIREISTVVSRLAHCAKLTNLNMLGNEGVSEIPGEFASLVRPCMPNIRILNSRKLELAASSRKLSHQQSDTGNRTPAGRQSDKKSNYDKVDQSTLRGAIPSKLAERRDKRPRGD
eukprot:GHVQ01013649.1.p1 GENE.GHVQ01013649.1~~GHVQ01013649.1.p1  ORF type:complete len:499 (+),score=46.56 GHVQ01013649.1:96-1592(+)